MAAAPRRQARPCCRCDSGKRPVSGHMSGSRRRMFGASSSRRSGVLFRTWSAEAIGGSDAGTQALKHPNWTMGPKVTIDSAHLMNKGLEVIEAHHLFALAPAEIDVLVHAQSIVHWAGPTFQDGSRMIAQLGSPEHAHPLPLPGLA